ncbi:hypothetical protein D6827_03150 [Candidatus Parcubacteria bacterium]|nr:MAG: hypothetical protein D6827_03150 [Candidatus Parcubacteria bacterium]
MLKRGILIDAEGYFLGAYQWAAEMQTPDFGQISAPARFKLLTDEACISGAGKDGRWLETEKRWIFPTDKFALIAQRRDAPRYWVYRKTITAWPHRLPEFGEGFKLIPNIPTLDKHTRPIWDDKVQKWITPKIYALLDKEGVVVNIVTALSKPKNSKLIPSNQIVRIGDKLL